MPPLCCCLPFPSTYSTQRRLSRGKSHGILLYERRETNMNHYITGAVIKRLREAKHLTQAQLAEKLCVSDKAVSKWETGVSHS